MATSSVNLERLQFWLLFHRARCIVGKIESYNDGEVRQDEDGPLEVVALSFAVHVREEEHTQDHCDHVPLREDEGCVGGLENATAYFANLPELTERLVNDFLAGNVHRVYGAV